jgi:hypothetical protein
MKYGRSKEEEGPIGNSSNGKGIWMVDHYKPVVTTWRIDQREGKTTFAGGGTSKAVVLCREVSQMHLHSVKSMEACTYIPALESMGSDCFGCTIPSLQIAGRCGIEGQIVDVVCGVLCAFKYG